MEDLLSWKKNKTICFLLFLFLLFSTSCQQKKLGQISAVPVDSTVQVPPIPRNYEIKVREPKEDPNKDTFDVRIELDYENQEKEEKILKESGIIFTEHHGIIIGKVTQKQFDLLKQKNIKVYKKWEWVKIEDNDSKSKFDHQSRFVPDAYKDLVDQEVKSGGINFKKSRIYRDLNQDGIPEIFFDLFGGTGGENYLIYQITKDGYREMGSYFYLEMQVLQTKHKGFCDIMTYTHLNAELAHFKIYEFTGSEYIATNEMFALYWDAIDEKIFQPDFQNEKKEKFDPKWSPKDDDKYRRMIK